MRIRIAPGFWTSRVGIGVLAAVLAVFLTATSIFAYYYIQFGHLVDQRLTGQIFQNTSRLYSAPSRIYTGEEIKLADLSAYLLRAGYQDGEVPGAPGQIHAKGSTLEIRPSKES